MRCLDRRSHSKCVCVSACLLLSFLVNPLSLKWTWMSTNKHDSPAGQVNIWIFQSTVHTQNGNERGQHCCCYCYCLTVCALHPLPCLLFSSKVHPALSLLPLLINWVAATLPVYQFFLAQNNFHWLVNCRLELPVWLNLLFFCVTWFVRSTLLPLLMCQLAKKHRILIKNFLLWLSF